MLGRNSANLMKNVVEAIHAAESACVKVHCINHAGLFETCPTKYRNVMCPSL